MRRSRRLLVLLLPLTLSLLSQALPGRAQQPLSARYAFADTTLLRDTLGLSFSGLFPTADSLQMTPDTLRALMIRYKLPMARILFLADSLRMPVDSVGPQLDRERLNPLSGRGSSTAFNYTSSYDIQQTSTTWTNGSTYNLKRGPFYLNNTANIELQRITSADALSLRQNRESTTEGGLAVSKRLSFGGRSYQLRFFSADPGATAQDEDKNEYSLTARGQANPAGLRSELNLAAGYLSDINVTGIKKGISSSADSRVRWEAGPQLSSELAGSVSGDVSNSRPPGVISDTRTHDFSTNLRGTSTVQPSPYAGLNLNYSLRNTRVENPVLVTMPADTSAGAPLLSNVVVSSIITRSNSVDGTAKLRHDNDRYFNLTGNASSTGSPTGTSFNRGGKGVLRWLLMGWAIDADYSDSRTNSVYLRQRGGGGYDQDEVTRNADGQAVRSLGTKIIAKLIGNVNLDRQRFATFSDSANPPSPRDQYHQSYRGEMLFTENDHLSSGLALEVSLTRSINILAATTGSNTDTREYRGEWRWNYRLLEGLTVNQNNQLVADYTAYPFDPTRNTLSLTYNTLTTISAVLPGGFSMDIQHNSSRLPRGSYTPQPDGFDYLQLSDDSRNYTLGASLRYQPTSAVGIHLEPRYQSSQNYGTVDDALQTQRVDKRLDFNGGVDLNLKVGRTGQLTGHVGRVYTDQRTLNFLSGVGTLTPRSQTDFWSGSLQLSWTL